MNRKFQKVNKKLNKLQNKFKNILIFKQNPLSSNYKNSKEKNKFK